LEIRASGPFIIAGDQFALSLFGSICTLSIHKVQILPQQSLSDDVPFVLCINQISALQVLALGLKVKHGPAAGANNIHYQFNIVDPIRLFMRAVSTRRARSQPTTAGGEAIGRYDFSPKCGKKRQIITLRECWRNLGTCLQGGNNVNFIAFNTHTFRFWKLTARERANDETK
jgi:hypothetical protein